MLDQHNGAQKAARRVLLSLLCLLHSAGEVANKQILEHTFLLRYMPHRRHQEKCTRRIWEKGEEMLDG